MRDTVMEYALTVANETIPLDEPAAMTATRFGRAGIVGRAVAVLATISTAFAPTAQAVPLVGGSGLCPNASALAQHIMANYPGVLSIGGVRADRLPDHPSGHAIDIMIGSNMVLGDAIKADVQSNWDNFGVKYVLWRVPQHFNHVHVTVF